MMEEPTADISRLYETGNALYRWDFSTKTGILWHPHTAPGHTCGIDSEGEMQAAAHESSCHYANPD